jgi:hypothetical protein
MTSRKDAGTIAWLILAVFFSILVECDHAGANLETGEGDNLEILRLLRCSAQRHDEQRSSCMSQVAMAPSFVLLCTHAKHEGPPALQEMLCFFIFCVPLLDFLFVDILFIAAVLAWT